MQVCEKALADYMESKRRAFPRFYFVSTADLLDILSNGNNPVKVMQHMSKCFQAIEKLRLDTDSTTPGERPKGCGMVSCVGEEYVPFKKPLALEDKVSQQGYTRLHLFFSIMFVSIQLQLYHACQCIIKYMHPTAYCLLSRLRTT